MLKTCRYRENINIRWHPTMSINILLLYHPLHAPSEVECHSVGEKSSWVGCHVDPIVPSYLGHSRPYYVSIWPKDHFIRRRLVDLLHHLCCWVLPIDLSKTNRTQWARIDAKRQWETCYSSLKSFNITIWAWKSPMFVTLGHYGSLVVNCGYATVSIADKICSCCGDKGMKEARKLIWAELPKWNNIIK